MYCKQCLEDRLLPFINKYRSDDNYVFWPDLSTTSQYANMVQKDLKDKMSNLYQNSSILPMCQKCVQFKIFWTFKSKSVREKLVCKKYKSIAEENSVLSIKNGLKPCTEDCQQCSPKTRYSSKTWPRCIIIFILFKNIQNLL